MSNDITELHCILVGRVQGVGFREFVRSIAFELRLTGYVKNLPEGSVEVVAQGEHGILKVFENHLKVGPPGAKVADYYSEWREPEETHATFEMP